MSRKKNIKETKIQKFMYGDITNVESETHDYACNNWSQQNGNKRSKETFGSRTKKTFDRFTTKGSYTWNITRNTGGAASVI
jgi:hypothetical protein